MLSITSHDDQRVNNFPPLRQSKISANPEAIAMTTNQFKSKKKKRFRHITNNLVNIYLFYNRPWHKWDLYIFRN